MAWDFSYIFISCHSINISNTKHSAECSIGAQWVLEMDGVSDMSGDTGVSNNILSLPKGLIIISMEVRVHHGREGSVTANVSASDPVRLNSRLCGFQL